MFRAAYRLPFRILGIPVEIHVSFLIVLPLFAYIIGSSVEPLVELFHMDVDPSAIQGGGFRFVLGLVAALGLFASVLIHELGHSMVGRALGMRIRVITLWLLGGMAQFEKMPRRRGHEAVMAIAGPMTSYVLAGISWGVLSFVPASLPAMVFVVTYLLWMNVALATFNLLPALPLDGGRIFRSLLALRWSYLRATQVAVSTSKVIAFSLAIAGIFVNLWLVLIAFFIYIAVVGEAQLATVAEVLEGIDVRDLMTEHVETVTPETRLSELMRRMMEEKHLAYPVVGDSGGLLGLVTLASVQGIAKEETRRDPEVREFMLTDFGKVRPGTTALRAFEQIIRNDAGRLLVVDDDQRLRGIISKTDLVRAVQVRMMEFSLRSEESPGSPV